MSGDYTATGGGSSWKNLSQPDLFQQLNATSLALLTPTSERFTINLRDVKIAGLSQRKTP